MKTTYDHALTLEELAALPDSDIDTSDIPELDETFWKNAKLVMPQTKQLISLRVTPEVLAYFKATSPTHYTTKMAAVLSAYVVAHQS
ncbi:BrnA antitoxin family protein [Thiofilum flexile]|uniref:BrnA antitoxin family protein n=1 Tax=Thiofilum flexile TaxID=125627 RepID=UPI000361BA59|nr:BrnA antitoxin family protein [Thiofilum flexile]